MKWLHPYDLGFATGSAGAALSAGALAGDTAAGVVAGSVFVVGFFAADRVVARARHGDWLYQPPAEFPGFPPEETRGGEP